MQLAGASALHAAARLLVKARRVKRPGSRGGRGYYDAHSEWRYGERPEHRSGAVAQYYAGWAPKWRKPTATEFTAARDKTSRPEYLSQLGPADMADHRLLLSADGTVGVAIDPHGDIQNLFNNGGPLKAAAEAVFAAIDAGGRTLDCFAGYLPDLYAQFGFEETGRMRFDPSRPPPGWDLAKNGQPDVVFMRWNGYPDAADKIRERIHGSRTNWRTGRKSERYYDDHDQAKLDSRRAGDSGHGSASRGSGLGRSERTPDSRTSPRSRGSLGPRKPFGKSHSTPSPDGPRPLGHLFVKAAAALAPRRTWLKASPVRALAGVLGWEEDGTAGVNPNRAYAPADLGMSPRAGASTQKGKTERPASQPKTTTKPVAKAHDRVALWRILAKAANILHPGIRGGRYWIDKQGMVRYGDRPEPLAHTSTGRPVYTVLHPSLAAFQVEHEPWRPKEHREAATQLRAGGTPHHAVIADAHEHEAAAKEGKAGDEPLLDRQLQASWGKGYDEVRKPAAPENKTAPPQQLSLPRAGREPAAAAAGYVYRDVGYVAGSRKELAQEAIRFAAKNGQPVSAEQVDWNALEENPRAAAALVTKGNCFGDVDWKTLEASGMEPGTGYLIRAIYASVASEPDVADLQRRQGRGGEDSGRISSMKRTRRFLRPTADQDVPPLTEAAIAQARQDYVRGLNTLRERLEKCRTPDDALQAIAEIGAERAGAMLTAAEADRYRELGQRSRALHEEERDYRRTRDAAYEPAKLAEAEYGRAKYEQENRTRRKWKPDPELDAEVARLKAKYDKLWSAFAAGKRDADEQRWRREGSELYHAREKIEVEARKRNLAENPITRAWHTLGTRFAGLLAYRDSDGSEAFARNVAAVKAGKITDWSWAATEAKTRGGEATKQSTRFQLLVADDFDRTGGRSMPIASSTELRDAFNLRAVQSGNWVLDDFNAGKFHMEQCAGAFADLADLLGVADTDVSMRGRLAMAFGARGKGGAKAHYEPVERVINITKMAGAGSLGHEWFHALDNLVMAAYGVEGADVFGTHPTAHANPKLPSRLREAFGALHSAMTTGTVRTKREMIVTADDDKLAAANLAEHRVALESSYGGRSWRSSIVNASSLDDAMAKLTDAYEAGRLVHKGRRGEREYAVIQRIAAAHWTKDHAGAERTVTVSSGPATSQYLADAETLNVAGGGFGKEGYWSSSHEMAARAFAGYCADRLAGQKRKNDYLTFKADNRYYAATPFKPYPEGAEREKINAAFDGLFAALREEKAFAKAAVVLTRSWHSWFKALLPGQLHARAHEAATSPHSERPHPTHAQIKAGNYKKGMIRWNGLLIRIENPAGSVRAGVSDGKIWLSKLRGAHYGYIRDIDGKAGPRGKDKEHVDIFVGPDLDSDQVFVIDQVKQTGAYDEAKIVIGVRTKAEALALYSAQYEAGWKVGPIVQLTVSQLRDWLVNGDTTKPVSAKIAKAIPSRPPIPEQRTASLERFPYGCIADTEPSRDRVDRHTTAIKGDALLHGPLRGIPAMLKLMFARRRQSEVGKFVVKSVAVNVVDDLGTKKSTATRPLHDDAVLKFLGAAVRADQTILGLVARGVSANMPAHVRSSSTATSSTRHVPRITTLSGNLNK